MKNKLIKVIEIAIIIGFCLGVASAITIYSGECRSIEFPNTDPVEWNVTGNSSNMEGFSYNKTGTNITYCFHLLYKPDNFTLIFYNYQYKEEYVPRGGGSSCKYNKNFDWNCSEWSECINETQTRICKKYNNCGNTYGKPNETQSCLEEPEEPDEPDEPKEPITVSKWSYILNWILLILIVCVLYIIFKQKKTKKKQKGGKNENKVKS